MCTEGRTPGRYSPRLVFGLTLMGAGILLTLENLGFVRVRHIFGFWPVFLIALGLAKLAQARARASGLLWIAFGVLLLLSNLHVLDIRQVWPLFLLAFGFLIVYRALRGTGPTADIAESSSTVEAHVLDIRQVWPLFLLAFGFLIVYRALRGTGPTADIAESSSTVEAFAMLGSVKRVVTASAFRGGSAAAVLGGCEIDLRGASIEGEATLDIFAFWGGIEIRVPEDWVVDNHAFALLAGIDDETQRPVEAKKRLVLTGFTVMGGVEVKN